MKKTRSNRANRFLATFLLIPAGVALMLVSSASYADLDLEFLTALATGVSTGSDSAQWGAGTHALLQTIDDVSSQFTPSSAIQSNTQNTVKIIKK
jgi:hypothetical protein